MLPTDRKILLRCLKLFKEAVSLQLKPFFFKLTADS